MAKAINEIGNKYGKLTVIERAGKRNNLATWLCKCDCGNTIIVPGAYLRSGNTKSCGCAKYIGLEQEREIKNKSSIKIGNQYGKLTIIKELDLRPHGTGGHKRRWYLCQCQCGNICEAMGNALQSGQKKSCGCLKSKGEFIIEKILKDNKINYKTEVVDKQLIKENQRRLRFDFGIYDKNNNLIKYIEFDGRQHFQGMESAWSQSESLDIIKERDSIKDNFCLENNIALARIPYTQIELITLEKILGDEYDIGKEMI